jgi:tripartite-type tricarboxylate transporter receptor subunit TctC
MARLHLRNAIIAAALVVTGTPVCAHADAVSDFYKGRTVTVVIPAGLGGSIGLYGKMLADHIGRHIPGRPTVVVQSMPGGGGVRAAQWAYNAGPKDGTAIAQLLSPSILAPALRGAKFDPTRVRWLGSIAPRGSVIMVWHTTPVKTLDDAKKTQVVLASGGRSDATYIVPVLLNQMIGTRFKVVTGYKGGGTMNKAVESGEVNGRYSFWTGYVTGKPQWIKEKKIRVLAQFGLAIRELAGVPRGRDVVTKAEHRKMLDLMSLSERVGLAFWVNPAVPQDRVSALRAAFKATMTDPAFLAATARRKAPVEPLTGVALEKIVADGYDVSPAVLADLKRMAGIGKGRK